MCLYASNSEPTTKNEKLEIPKPPHVSIGTIVGGMSTQKQRRILDRGIDILVATPGRLWDILEDVSIYSRYLLLVVDFKMVDRMTSWQKR